MNKKILCLLGLLTTISSVAFADYDFGINDEWGYSGLEFSVGYDTFNSKNNNIIKEIYAGNKSEVENTINYLRYNDNRDKSEVLKLGYNYFNSKNISNNNISLLLGYSKDIESRLGLLLSYSPTTLKVENNSYKGEKIGGEIFYHFDNSETFFTTVGYVNSINYKNDAKFLDYGIKAQYEKLFANAYFEYFEPSYFISANVEKVDYTKDKKEKNNDTKRNMSITSEIGVKAENVIEIEDVLVRTTISTSYEREYMNKEKYKSLNIKNKESDNLNLNVKCDIKFTEVFSAYVSTGLSKSLNGGHSNKTSIGFKLSI